mmetsp:Transcript_41200/g.67638  ORF Transcript_41200/g.67638 Transcript_41200/m.67638 type:complete len:558 (-) Transcript_41200:199-1872(-)
MSEQTAYRPVKKAKQTRSPSAELPSLLAALNSGKALDLPTMAAIAIKPADGSSCDNASTNPHTENRHSTLNKLFADHAGKSPETVIGNAIRHAKEEVQREAHVFNKKENGTYFGNERQKWLNHPKDDEIFGPHPDGKVWLELFLGGERAEELLKGTAPMNSKERKDGSTKDTSNTDTDRNDTEGVILKCLEGEASQLSTTTLLGNILSYTRNEASKVPSLNDLLRFSILYGLDGVMKDIIQGHYGDIGDLTINTPLPLDDKPLEDPTDRIYLGRRRMFMPPYAMGTIIGHSNIVVTALAELGAKLDTPYGVQFKSGEEMRVFDENHDLPTQVFYWIFQKNMPDMMECLVKECGFQFRWIDHDDHIPSMFKRIFDADEYASLPKWAGDIEEEDLMWESRHDKCRMRAESAYKVQMKMLDLLIHLGFPFELFFPTEPPVELEARLRKEKKLKTRQECNDFRKSLSKEQAKAREVAYLACSAYNSIQESEPETLALGDYYRKLKSRWEDGQESVQVASLDEFEVLDSRWRKRQKRQNAGDGNGSDYESGDGSSYADDSDY